jgi:hypothetical protein
MNEVDKSHKKPLLMVQKWNHFSFQPGSSSNSSLQEVMSISAQGNWPWAAGYSRVEGTVFPLAGATHLAFSHQI